MKKIECNFSKEYLQQCYIDENRTLLEMCPIIGVKSPITARKILQSFGISTNHNERVSLQTRKGMTDEQFKKFLISEYQDKQLPLRKISQHLGVNSAALRKYFYKYGISLRETSEAKSIATKGAKSIRWRGGKHICNNGYIEVYCPEHPRAKSRKYVYEHILVMEKHLGRYLLSDEVVHHKNEIKTDNRLENLQLLTNKEHIALHGYKSKGRSKNILHGRWSKQFSCCTNCGTTSIKHKANGLCKNCYATQLRNKTKGGDAL